MNILITTVLQMYIFYKQIMNNKVYVIKKCFSVFCVVVLNIITVEKVMHQLQEILSYKNEKIDPFVL